MYQKLSEETKKLMEERFGRDCLISLATIEENRPYVRVVNSYYENGAFYTITYALSNKMRQIEKEPHIALCGDWFTAQGTGENLGYVGSGANNALITKLRKIFSEWYDNGHINESDPNTCILRIRLEEGVLFHHGTRYEIDFREPQANRKFP